MFDKNKFAKILREIYETFDTQREFSSKVGVSRGYLSEYMNMKKEKPPSPKILENISANSKGMTNYRELMQVCGYTDYLMIMFQIKTIKFQLLLELNMIMKTTLL